MVYSVKASDVRTVMVAGKAVVEERQVNTLDAKAILAEARRYGDSVRAYKTRSPNSRRGSYYFMTRQKFLGAAPGTFRHQPRRPCSLRHIDSTLTRAAFPLLHASR